MLFRSDRKSTRLNSSHTLISYAVFCLKKKKTFASLAGLSAPSWADGVSLVPSLTGGKGQRDKGYLYFEFADGGSTPDFDEFPNHRGTVRGEMQAVRVGNYMGVRTKISSAQDDFLIYDVV